jgi:hypothetical protein
LTFDRRQQVVAVLKQAFPEFPVFFGFDYIPELKACIQSQKPFIFADHAYFDRGYEAANFRVIHSDIHQRSLKDRKAKVPKMHPWRRGKNILVFPPSRTIAQTFDAKDWVSETVAEIQKHTDRPIVVKRKEDGALKPFLEDAHAAIGFGTVASVEAALHGVPLFCGPRCPGTPIGLQDLSQIENPITPDRAAWFSSLCWSQFHISEIQKGLCREVLLGAG